jgi:hypothetical protein
MSMNVKVLVVCIVLFVLAASMVTVSVRVWRNPEMIGDNVPFTRMLPFDEAGRHAMGRAMGAWSALIVFTLAVVGAAIIHGPSGTGKPQNDAVLTVAYVGIGGILLSAVAMITITSLNRPKFLVPPHQRSDKGLLELAIARRRSRRG